MDPPLANGQTVTDQVPETHGLTDRHAQWWYIDVFTVILVNMVHEVLPFSLIWAPVG